MSVQKRHLRIPSDFMKSWKFYRVSQRHYTPLYLGHPLFLFLPGRGPLTSSCDGCMQRRRLSGGRLHCLESDAEPTRTHSLAGLHVSAEECYTADAAAANPSELEDFRIKSFSRVLLFFTEKRSEK